MIARTRLGARQTRRHLQRSACYRQPVDRRTTRQDRRGIARTNPRADERPFRQRVIRSGHVSRVSREQAVVATPQRFRFRQGDGKKPNSSAQSDAAPSATSRPRARTKYQRSYPTRAGSYDRACKTSPTRATSRSIGIPSGLQPFSGLPAAISESKS